MRLLILGGTVFLGRHLVAAALERGHDVTLFNRGQSNTQLFPNVEKLHGNRDGGLDSLRGRQWDAVIDTSGYVPRVVGESARLLANVVEHYTFVSSISVYKRLNAPGMDERASIGTLDDPTIEEITGESYGPLKALCEQVVERELPGRTLIVRPGLIVGPHDYTDRFTYWPRRVQQGGDVLAPEPATQPVQFIDARDLAEWIVRMAEQRQTGAFNANGQPGRLTMQSLLESCKAATDSDAAFVWVDAEFLINAGVQPWLELPVWLGPPDPDHAGFMAVSVDKAVAAGLTFRPLATTIRDTLAWDATRPDEHEQAAQRNNPRVHQPRTLTREREAELIKAWRDRSA